MMKRLVEAAIVAALLAWPHAAPVVSAQQGAQAEPLRIIPTDSLFDRYLVEPKWGHLPAGQPWGGVTTGVAADGTLLAVKSDLTGTRIAVDIDAPLTAVAK